MKMDQHVTIVAVLHIAFSVLGILAAVIVFLAIAGGGLLSGELESIAVTGTVATILAFVILVVSVPGLIGGFGLLKHQSWARILILILSFLNLLNIPIGTIVGGYSIWVLINAETTKLFSS